MGKSEVKISVNLQLLEKAKQKFPETKGLTWTGLVDFLIRKALRNKEAQN